MSLAWTWGEFGDRVRKLRKAKGLTQSELGQALGALGADMHQTTVAKIENGTRPTVVHEVWALAKILDVDYDALLPALTPPDHDPAEELVREYKETLEAAHETEVSMRKLRNMLRSVESESNRYRRELFELATQLPPSVVQQLDQECGH